MKRVVPPCPGITSGQEQTERSLSVPGLAEDQLLPGRKGVPNPPLQSISPCRALEAFERLHPTNLLLPLLLTLLQYLKVKQFLEDLLQGTGKFPRSELQRATMNWEQCFQLQFPSSSPKTKKGDASAGQGVSRAVYLLWFCLGWLFPTNLLLLLT